MDPGYVNKKNESPARTPEEEDEAQMGAAVAKVGIFALVIGLFMHVFRMIRGGRKSASKSS